MKAMQYTLRQIPEMVDRALRQKSRQEGRSLNEVAIEALAAGAGVAEESATYHDLDDLIGSWKRDPKFDEAIRAQDQIDPNLWK